MYTSESLKNLGPALLKAQTLMGAAVKGSSNPYFKSKYADLGAVLEACKDLLNTNGVVILQPVNRDALGTFVETTLLHAESGEFISSVTPVVFVKEGDPQAQGSAITYARRYGLQSLLSMPAEDDDAEKAMTRTKKETKKVDLGPVTQTILATPETQTIHLDAGFNQQKPRTEQSEARPKTTFRKPKNEEQENGKTDDLGLS